MLTWRSTTYLVTALLILIISLFAQTNQPYFNLRHSPGKMFRKLKDTVSQHLEEGKQRLAESTSPLEPGHSSSHAYWKATLGPNVAVTQDWRQETGASGWGNNELQDYTTDQRNSHVQAVDANHYALSLRAVVEPERITSARLTSHQTLGRDKGYLVARITSPSASKLQLTVLSLLTRIATSAPSLPNFNFCVSRSTPLF